MSELKLNLDAQKILPGLKPDSGTLDSTRFHHSVNPGFHINMTQSLLYTIRNIAMLIKELLEGILQNYH